MTIGVARRERSRDTMHRSIARLHTGFACLAFKEPLQPCRWSPGNTLVEMFARHLAVTTPRLWNIPLDPHNIISKLLAPSTDGAARRRQRETDVLPCSPPRSASRSDNDYRPYLQTSLSHYPLI